MAFGGGDALPIENKVQLIEDLEGGCKPPDQWRIGTEHEKQAFFIGDRALPVPFEGERGIEALLRELALSDDNASGVYEDDKLIGLKLGGAGDLVASVTLEPGGQVELSGAPLKNVHETKAEVDEHLANIVSVGERLGIGFLGLGFSPKFSLAETPQMPKGRYDVMRRYMPKVGRYGLNMMHQSATVQVNLDFASEDDMVRKFRIGLALQPVATALFANSVFTECKLNGFQSFRSEIWRDVDADRTGMLPFVFEEGMGFERYIDYALKVPMYFLYRGGQYHDVAGASFEDFLAGKLSGHESEIATMDDWELHLTTLFPEVRLKRFLEMRGADCGPKSFITALSALWVGLLYDESALDAAYDLIKPWDEEVRASMRADVTKQGLKTQCGDWQLRDIAREVVAISASGLKGRSHLLEGQDERLYLEPLQQIVEERWSQADILIDRFNTQWGQDIESVFVDYKF